MDTLDKVTPASTDTSDTYASLRPETAPESVDGDQFDMDDVDDAPVATQKSGLWKFLAAGVVVGVAAVAGYAYWRNQQQKPRSRFERFKSRLGLDRLDTSSVPAAIRSVDYDKLNRARRDAGTYAKKTVHIGAKKVAELTR